MKLLNSSKKKEEGFVDKSKQKTFLGTLEKKKEEAIKAQNKLETIKSKSTETDSLSPIAKIIERATSNLILL